MWEIMKKVVAFVLTFLMVGLLVFEGVAINKTQEQLGESEVVVTEEVEIKEPIHYLTDEELSLLYTCKQDVRKESDTVVEIDYEDAQKLMKLANCEDNTDEIVEAKIISVVLNRQKDESFPDTIEDVINQEIQFSCVSDGRYEESEPDAKSHMALALIEMGAIKTKYLYFEAKSLEDSWQSKNRKFGETYAQTTFYY